MAEQTPRRRNIKLSPPTDKLLAGDRTRELEDAETAHY